MFISYYIINKVMDGTLPSTLLYLLSLECDFDILPDLAQCSSLLNDIIHDYFFIKNKFKEEKILNAIQNNNFNWALRYAAECGHRDLCEWSIELGANKFDLALGDAAQGGHRDLCELFIQLGANKINWALECAARNGHRDLCELFVSKGAHRFNWALSCAAYGGHHDLIKWLKIKQKEYAN